MSAGAVRQNQGGTAMKIVLVWFWQGRFAFRWDNNMQVTSINNAFYDALAEQYHLLYRDWEATLEREGLMLRSWFRDREIVTVLDASCGPGTQSIALAQIGYRVLASDPSAGMIQRAKKNAEAFECADRISFLQAGFLDIAQMTVGDDGLDAIVTKGNSFPHLVTDEEIEVALAGFYQLLRPGGTILIGMLDYEALMEERPHFLPGRVHEPEDNEGQRMVVFEIWDWDEGPPRVVTVNNFILRGEGLDYETHCYPIKYRVLTGDEVQVVLLEAGFEDIQIIKDRSEMVIMGTKPKEEM